MAVKTIPDIKPRKDVVHLLVELLKDPCVSVAHETLFPLMDYYDLKERSGERPHVTTFWRGRATGLYYREQQEIYRVAELLNSKDAELVSVKDLDKIRSREVPSDEWFLGLGLSGDALPRVKKHFREQYLKNQRAEQDGADQPATTPESKPEGKEKPQPESKRRSQ